MLTSLGIMAAAALRGAGMQEDGISFSFGFFLCIVIVLVVAADSD
jgi:hypothetical protein